MGRVVVFAFIRNEVDDIGWWLAHYIGLGASTVIVCDDFSDDGTWSLLQAAQTTGRVVAMRSDPNLPSDQRRAAALQAALIHVNDPEDWFAALSVDEYIVFDDPAQTLPASLTAAEDADAVAFSHCVFGAGAHVLKPCVSPLRAYDRHAFADFSGHGLASVFVRARALDASALGQDFYGIARHRTVMAAGSPAVFHEDGQLQPNWHRARTRKYVCRSMEHFVSRARGVTRSDLADLWRHHDRNDDYAPGPDRPGRSETLLARLYRDLWGA